MISRLKGVLLTRESDRIELETAAGVVYEIEVPLTVLQRLPAPGAELSIRTLQVVTETSVALYGFHELHERTLFQRLLGASGIGPKLALAMMSKFDAPRLARAIVEKDLTALQQIPGVAKKKAEKIALELADKVGDVAIVVPIGAAAGSASGAHDAVKALVALGLSFDDADEAVRAALGDGKPMSTEALIRKALSKA